MCWLQIAPEQATSSGSALTNSSTLPASGLGATLPASSPSTSRVWVPLSSSRAAPASFAYTAGLSSGACASHVARCGLMNDEWFGSFQGLSAPTFAPSRLASASRLRIMLR